MTENQARDFAELALTLHDESSLDDTVGRVLEFAIKAVGCDHAGVIFVSGGRKVETVAATDPLVARLDQVQLEVGSGPDIDVLQDRYSISVPDTRNEPRWPEWASAAAEAGVGCMIGTRLYTSGTTIGSLNLYAVEVDKFDVSDREVAHVLARHAAIALDTARDTENLWRAIDARKLIGQAQGILMERYQIDPDRAFEVLRRFSQDRNVKLRLVAQQLVDTGHLPD